MEENGIQEETDRFMTRRQELFLTVISNLVLQAASAVCGFVLPPLIVGTFGSEMNGMVSSIAQFIAYLSLVEAGIGGAAVAALYRPLAMNDVGGRNSILSAAVRFYNRSGILFTALVFVLAFLYPLIVGNQVDRMQSALMVLVLGITGAAEFFLIGKYRVLLTADKKMYVISAVQMLAVIMNTAVAAVMIKLGFGIIAVKLVSALVYLSRYVFLAFYVNKKYRNLDFYAEPDMQAVRQSKSVLVHQIGGIVVFNSPLVIITLFCSLKDASVYTVYAMVFNAVNQLLGSFINGMQSFFGELMVKDDLELTRKIFSRYETLFFTVEGWVYSMAYLLIMPFMRLYTSKMTDAEYIQPLLAALFVAVGVLNNLRQPGNMLIGAVGHFQKTQYRSLMEAIINVVCSTVFTIIFGFIGVLFGGVCSYLYRTIDILMYTNRHILVNSTAKSVSKIALFFLYFVLAVLVLKHIPVFIPSYLIWIIYALVYGVLLLIPLGVAKIIQVKFFCPRKFNRK
ncbi:MAG: hypothetical protein J6K96_02715 [Treponema sp.]|nr:hypothetical protein [Treponema sp.]